MTETECNACFFEDTCTPFEKQLDIECLDFLDLEFISNCYSYRSGWKEFSWNKYSEDILDYGEETEWERWLSEDNILY